MTVPVEVLHVVAQATVLVLAALSLLHVYWALVGGTGAGVVPEVDGAPVFRPSALASWSVAAALAGAAFLVSQRAGIGMVWLPGRVAEWGTWLVAVAFLGRAIGDFRLVGFFKRVRGTRFAAMDSWIYSPLCVGIGCAAAVVAAVGG